MSKNKYEDHSKVKEARSCLRKRALSTKEQAIEAVRLSKKCTAYYKCRYCSKWHLTSSLTPRHDKTGHNAILVEKV